MPPASALFVNLAALFAVTVWGASPPMTKVAVASFDPVLVAVLRTVIGGIAAAPLVLFLRMSLPRDGIGIGLLLLASFCGYVGFPIVFSIGIGLTSAAHGALALAILPLFTGLFAALVERRLPGRNWWIGTAIALLGEVCLITFRSSSAAAGTTLAGDLIVLASATIASAGYVAGARLAQRGYSSWNTTFWGVVIAGLAMIMALPFAGAGQAGAGQDWQAAPLSGWLAILYLAIGVTIVGYVAWYWALGAGGIARIGVFQFLQMPVGLIIAIVFLGEPLTLTLTLSAALIFVGVYVGQRK
ncbi:MAG: DMT family transporter [Alphaproteobacteria bacterium]|nr:DMT family transporter [Alphaproteobacteria bacterium]